MKKIYPIKFYTTGQLDDFERALAVVRSKKEDFADAYEKECEQYRKEIGTKNLIGLTVGEGAIGIVEFPIEVERNTYHELKTDEEGIKYIEIEEEAE